MHVSRRVMNPGGLKEADVRDPLFWGAPQTDLDL